MPSIIVWDIETVPDLSGFAAANASTGRSDDEVRAEMGEKFPKLIYHSIVCIGALVAQRREEHWTVSAFGAPHIGERSEKEIISGFVNRIAKLTPQLVTFNGVAFDFEASASSRWPSVWARQSRRATLSSAAVVRAPVAASMNWSASMGLRSETRRIGGTAQAKLQRCPES